MDGAPPRALTAEAMPVFSEGTYLILSRWSALRMAVDNEWGGRDSSQKADQLTSDIISWFTQSRGTFFLLTRIESAPPCSGSELNRKSSSCFFFFSVQFCTHLRVSVNPITV